MRRDSIELCGSTDSFDIFSPGEHVCPCCGDTIEVTDGPALVDGFRVVSIECQCKSVSLCSGLSDREINAAHQMIEAEWLEYVSRIACTPGHEGNLENEVAA